jgi:small-conductance mechanosensitive channel
MPDPRHPTRRAARVLICALVALVEVTAVVHASQNPLQPPSTDSPRATIESFLSSLTEAADIAAAGRPSADTLEPLSRARRCLNLSALPPELAKDQGIEAALMLKEVLDRIELPAFDQIPDRAEVKRASQDNALLQLLARFRGDEAESGTTPSAPIQHWSVPNTDITLSLVTDGPRQGEFLFNPETVSRAAEFYNQVRNLPYHPNATPYIYEAYVLTPGQGLQVGWGQWLPHWAAYTIYDQTVWQWLLALGLLLVTVLLVRWMLVLGRRWDRRAGGGHAWRLGTLLAAAASFALIAISDHLIDNEINITGEPLAVFRHILIVARYGFLAWLTALVLTQGGEAIIHTRKLAHKGPSSQLIRLASRLVALVVIPGILVYAAQRIGLPAYSVITGLGVGGLAVALAARETLANLFGSLMIMFDRPFRIGDWVKLGGNEGTVEDIGFRSTRIRTFYDSLLSIPNSESISKPIDNMGRRSYRRVFTRIGIRYDTPPERIEAFLEGIKGIIQANPHTRKDYFHVVLNDFGPSSLTLMLYFFLKVKDWSAELVERQRVFLEILRLAEALGVAFAFPTQTLAIETFPGQPHPEATAPNDDEELRRLAHTFGAGGSASRPRGTGIFTPPSEEPDKPS